jgi:hypothetical protein
MVTQDMAFAAFLVHQGFSIKNVIRNGRRVSWSFDVTDAELASTESEWPSSDESRFFNIYQTLKNQIRKV